MHFLWSVFLCSAFASRCVGRFGCSKYFHRASINIHYFLHPCVLKLFAIAFHCGVTLGLRPAVFSVYSSCIAMGSCTGNLCIISALLMLCLCRPLKSTTLWNKTPCFLSSPLLFFSNSPLKKKKKKKSSLCLSLPLLHPDRLGNLFFLLLLFSFHNQSNMFYFSASSLP